jgi:hypothetical protein
MDVHPLKMVLIGTDPYPYDHSYTVVPSAIATRLAGEKDTISNCC